EFETAIGHGVVKVNLDTDLQYALHGENVGNVGRDGVTKKDYIMRQVGNPEGDDKPNKKYFDPRVWDREGEKTMSARMREALRDFNTANQL
ncbi:ketose-bisphosphate aldolase, partial [Tuber magnatum]